VAAADHNDFLAGGVERGIGIVESMIELVLGIGREKIHGEMDAIGGAPFNRQIARLRGAAAEHHGVEFLAQALDGPLAVLADVYARLKFDPLIAHELEAALDDLAFVELHVGDAIHEKPAGPIGTFEYHDSVARLIQLVRTGEAGRTGADDRDASVRPLLRG